MDLLERFWPGLVGALIVGFFGYKLLSGSPAPPDRPLNEIPQLERSPSILEDEDAGWEETPEERAERLKSEDPRKKRVVFVEKPIVVKRPDPVLRTFTESSPEVKQALAEVEIEILAVPGSAEARKAAEYLEHNGLTYAARDAGDAMVQERARRLSGNAAVGRPSPTVVVVDGQPVLDPEEGELQRVLQSAVKQRVERTLEESVPSDASSDDTPSEIDGAE